MEISIFDVLGPVMIGPSSSHTAGAAKLARVAREIVNAPFFHVNFALHGSFGETYKGHGTDKALVAGALGIPEDDERLRDAFDIAREQGLTFTFSREDLGNVHENTVKMTFYLGESGSSTDSAPVRNITGSSIGGGQILVTKIDRFETEISMRLPTVVVIQKDVKGVVGAVAGLLAEHNINIGVMKLSRTAKGQTACCVIETDDPISPHVVEGLSDLPNIMHVQAIGGIAASSHQQGRS